ncbi:hypothetical protein [Deinococcus radiodurans]|uniref:hypothetical protein n=1 Tax=Deinococcus radiodurans TaxID=1299 RepID=UPI002017E43E|nr:hypothetical protein [Deinococcus radiodurans]
MLGLPQTPYRTHLVTATYIIVLFSIAVQGLTIMPLVHKAVAASPDSAGPDSAGPGGGQEDGENAGRQLSSET